MADFDAEFDKALIAAVPLEQQITELKREYHMRRTAYPKFIAGNKLTTTAAMQQMLRLNAAIATLEKLLADEKNRTQPSLSLEAPAR